jgi:hypothetical protein
MGAAMMTSSEIQSVPQALLAFTSSSAGNSETEESLSAFGEERLTSFVIEEAVGELSAARPPSHGSHRSHASHHSHVPPGHASHTSHASHYSSR